MMASAVRSSKHELEDPIPARKLFGEESLIITNHFIDGIQ